MQESFGAIKEIKVLQRSNEFIKTFGINNKILSLSEFKQTFADSLPRLWLEWLAIIGFVLLIFIIIFQGKELFYVVPLLGLFAAAAFRIMPSITRIMNSLQGMLYNLPTIDTVYEEFNPKNLKHHMNSTSPEKLSFNKNITLKNVDFKYSESSPLILKNINLDIKSGTTIGLIGESGIGKTTLINIILGLIQPSKGGIYVDGIDISKNIEIWQNQIGYVPQNIYLTDDSIKKNIALALPDEKIDDNAVKNAVKNAQLNSLIENLDEGIPD